MIFKDYGLADFKYDGDNTIYHHVQDIDPTLKGIQERRKEMGGGWSKERSMRYIGSIPFIELERNPDLKAALTSGDQTAIDKAIRLFLQTEGGRRYQVNPIDSGKSAQCIIK